MSSDQITKFGKSMPVQMTLGALIAFVVGAFMQGDRIGADRIREETQWSQVADRLDSIEETISDILVMRMESRWTWQMEQYSQQRYKETGEWPEIHEVRRLFEPEEIPRIARK